MLLMLDTQSAIYFSRCCPHTHNIFSQHSSSSYRESMVVVNCGILLYFILYIIYVWLNGMFTSGLNTKSTMLQLLLCNCCAGTVQSVFCCLSILLFIPLTLCLCVPLSLALDRTDNSPLHQHSLFFAIVIEKLARITPWCAR